jgi:hypothetical protein
LQKNDILSNEKKTSYRFEADFPINGKPANDHQSDVSTAAVVHPFIKWLGVDV